MLRLTREVRFAINPDGSTSPPSPNGHAANPPLLSLGHYLTLRVTLAGHLDPTSQYLLNIKEVDRAVRDTAVPRIAAAIRNNSFSTGGPLTRDLFLLLQPLWPAATLDCLSLHLSPALSLAILHKEPAMIRLSQRFEFSASHRLYNPALSDADNRAAYGKCSNPHGHGHNYELQVTLKSDPQSLLPIPDFERLVAETVIDPFDHKNLNVEVPEFKALIPSVENIAAVIYHRLKPRFAPTPSKLASVTVWETPKTWCEYAEE